MTNLEALLPPLQPGDVRRHEWLSVLPIALLALWVRLRGLDEQSLWIDELRQVLMYYGGGLRQIMYGAAAQGQPPLDYWIGHLVFRFDQSDFAARLPAAVFGTLTVPAVFFLARRLVGLPVAVLVAVGVACSPYAIHYSQEARPFALFWFSLILSTLLLVRAWQSNRWRDWGLLLPVLCCCQFSRTLEPLMVTSGMGVLALIDLYRELRLRQSQFLRDVLSYRGTRLLLCLIVGWLPFLNLLAYIMERQSKWNYLGEHGGPVDWEAKWTLLGMAVESLGRCATPLGVVLVPLGLVGVWLALRRRIERSPGSAIVIFLPVMVGYVLHVVVYTIMVRNELPKYVYWGYMLPFLYLGAGVALQHAVDWFRLHRPGTRWNRLAWMTAACALALQVFCDPGRATVNKEDWRGAMRVIAENMDPENDVVFLSEAAEYGSAGMVFRVSPHYLPTDQHLVNLLRDPEKMFNDGRPILDRRDCRVALVMSCPPAWTPDVVQARMSSTGSARFSLHPLNQFVVLVSHRRYETAEAGLVALGEVANKLFVPEESLGVYFNMGLAWGLAKRGEFARAQALSEISRALVSAEFRKGFDLVYAPLLDLIRYQALAQRP